jgi:hypothetical protein
MISRAVRAPKLKIKSSYSLFTIIEQLSKLSANPSKFTSERRGYEELSRLAIPLIILSLLMSLILVPALAYSELRSDVSSKYYESLGELEMFPSGKIDEQKANEEIMQITSNSIRYIIAERWWIVIIAGLIIIPLYALLLLLFFFLRALIRHTYLKALGGKGYLEKQFTLEAYYALLWGPIGVILFLFIMAVSFADSFFAAFFLFFVILAINVWNWFVYVNSIATLHSFKKTKAFAILVVPLIASFILVGLLFIVLIGMAAKVLMAAGV